MWRSRWASLLIRRFSSNNWRCFFRRHLEDILDSLMTFIYLIYFLKARSFCKRSRWSHAAGSPKFSSSSDALTCLNCSIKIVSARFRWSHLIKKDFINRYRSSRRIYLRTASSFFIRSSCNHTPGSPKLWISSDARNSRNCSTIDISVRLRSSHSLFFCSRNSSAFLFSSASCFYHEY